MSETDKNAPPKAVRVAKADAKKTIGKLIGDDAAIEKARADKAAMSRGRHTNANEQE